MSYTTEKEKDVSNKVAILQVSNSAPFSTWINYEAGIWAYTLTPASPLIEDTGSTEYWFYTNMSNQTVVVNAMTVDATSYTLVTSLASLRATNESFYWDNVNQIIYVHFTDNNPYYLFTTILVGIIQGYTNKAFYDEDDTYYKALIQSLPKISMKRDPLFFGMLSFGGGSVTMSNVEADFNGFDIFGETVVGKFGFKDLDVAEWNTVFSMYAENVSFDFAKATFQIRDKRKKLSRNIPTNVFDIATYPDISDDDENKPIPVAWGTVRDCPVVMTNTEEAGPANYVIKLCDTTYHDIKSGQTPVVYVNGVPVGTGNFDEAAGTCTIGLAVYTPGDNEELTADFIGLVDAADDPIVNSLDILKDILVTYGGAAYTADQFNTTEWVVEESNTYDIELFVNEKTKISEIIEKICISNMGIFIVQNNGKYTFRTYDEDRASSLTITYDELLKANKNNQYADIKVSYPSAEYLTDCTVKYDPGWNDARCKQIENTTYQAAVYAAIGVYNTKTFETYLANSADAVTIAETIMLRSKDIVQTLRIKTMQRAMELEIMQFVRLSTDDPRRDLFGDIIAEVLAYSKNMLTGEVDLTLRYVKQATVLSGIVARRITYDDADGIGSVIAHYAFDDDATDSSSNRYDGTAENDPTYGAGHDGQAIHFNGTDQRVSMPSTVYTQIVPQLDWSMAAWVKLDTLTPADSDGRIVGVRLGVGDSVTFFYDDVQTRFEVFLNSSTDVVFSVGVAGTATTDWTHLVVTWDATTLTLTLYIDNVAQTAGVGVTVPADTATSGHIGAASATGYLDGMVDDVRIFSKVLTPEEIDTIYTNPDTKVDRVTGDGTIRVVYV